MALITLTRKDFVKALGVGILTALILSAITVPAFMAGLPPAPQPPSLAFAEALFGATLPLAVGVLFHVAYVTAWSVIYVGLFRERLSFLRALGLAAFLWAVALVVFFPINGWGFLGLGVGPKMIPFAAVPHLLFAIVLWGLCRWAFRPESPADEAVEESGETQRTGA